jgi:hypothetical protein
VDPIDILKQEWPVIRDAPVLSIALLIVGGICAWWLRGRNAVAEIAGLKAQIAARDAILMKSQG